MKQLSYGSDQVMESMMDSSNILDAEVRMSYRTISIGRGRRIQLVKSHGRFCEAYKLENDFNKICYRIWKEIIPDAIKRYELIDKRFSSAKLRYFSNFRFIPSALRMKCDGNILPGIVMDWIEGKTLDSFLSDDWSSLSVTQRLTFIRDFYYMCYELRENGISHGDLSCVNIIITSNREIRLVDYDSVYVKEMGRKFFQTTGGAPSFQHPERTFSKRPILASIDDDNFSQLIIAVSLWVIYFDPSVTQYFDDSNLLFVPSDLSGLNGNERLNNLKASFGWKKANSLAHKFQHLSILLKALESIQGDLSKVPSLFNFVSESTILSPQFYSLLDTNMSVSKTSQRAIFCTTCGHKFTSDIFDFCPICGTKRYLFKN
ncbi:protein kinase [Bacteroides caecigallinarum]|uniref:protein kinase n=1 Tax=Bacteroides caecigallinarum TaxID=1411144 RepID=UPI0019597746|nr:protein kinase [Bacteroides caecigallinarum]MBM6883990.1 protein kinase [Bacteroides caecigallinarum]